MYKAKINNITFVTAIGVKAYQLGEMIGGKEITKIQVASLYFTGDPFDHYCVYSNDELLASINPLCPCTVEYL